VSKSKDGWTTPTWTTQWGPISQLTRVSSEGSLRAEREVTEGDAQVTQSLAGTYDLSRSGQIGDRDRDRTGAGRDNSPGGTWVLRLMSF